MGSSSAVSEQHRTLSKRLKKTLAACAVSALFAIGGLAPVIAGGETRTLSLYHIHTGESLTVTYMKDGRYVPSAMKQINYLLRDWRRNEVITIDPRTVDLVWELHEDLGSHEPVRIVCGYRSAQTNALLHRIGRHVAKESQHIQGKAIDFYLSDVPTLKIRNVALVRQVGGVGYYSSSGGPTGFLHVDSGHVRHWGPYISPSQMAQIFRDGQKYVGRRLTSPANAADDTAVASNDSGSKQAPQGFIGRLLGIKGKQAPAPSQVADISPDPGASASDQADMADLSSDASATPAKPTVGKSVTQAQMASLGDLAQDASQTPKTKTLKAVAASADDSEDDTADVPDSGVKQARLIPKPRIKPIEIMLMAAANMKTPSQLIRINAASAPPPSQTGHDAPSPVADSLGTLMEAASIGDVPQKPAAKPKSTLAADLKNGTANGIPVIKPLIASVSTDTNWWPQLMLRGDAAIRRNGQPPLIGTREPNSLPKPANIAALAGGSSAYAADLPEEQRPADGKGDLAVNEDGKSDLSSAN